MLVETLSTFPRMYDSVMGSSIMRIAQEKGILDFRAYDLREWTHDKHRTTDDYPFGGGQGLVMKPEPIFEAYDSIVASAAAEPGQPVDTLRGSIPAKYKDTKPYTVFLTPCGRRFDEMVVNELATHERILFVCGHYEGIDERVYTLADACISLGDYVLSSGELASMVVIDAVVRKLPGVLGDAASAIDESFHDGLLEYPQYTRPASYRGMDVPSVLLSGDHGAVAVWRRRMSLERTANLRPDLLESANITPEEAAYLEKLSR